MVYANTLLTHAEHSMPKALGEFGKAKHSDVAHKILQMLESSTAPVSLKDIWIAVHNDMGDISELRELIANLTMAEKIIATKAGFIPKRRVIVERSTEFVDFSLLTDEERSFVV